MNLFLCSTVLEVFQVRRLLILLRWHQIAVSAQEIDFLSDSDVVVSLFAGVVDPVAIRGLPAKGLFHRPGMREGVVDGGDVVVKQFLVLLVAIRNALLGASRIINAIDAIANAFAPDAVATVGLIENRPNSRNVIPGEVFFAVDLRHRDDAVLDRMEQRMRATLPAILDPLKLAYEEKSIWTSPAVGFAPELIRCVRQAAEKAGFATRDMVSGAGHDAVYVARVAPTTMIFVPCLNGISHNEAESTTFEQCAAGAQVLLDAVLEYDRGLA